MKTFDLGRVRDNINKLKKDLPIALANQAKNFFAQKFKDGPNNQNWDGEPWPEVQRRLSGTKAYQYPKSGAQRTRAMLVKSGRLRRAVQDLTRKNATIRFDLIRLVLDVPYAGYHNTGAGKIPRRKFMGKSAILQKAQREKISKMIDKVFKD